MHATADKLTASAIDRHSSAPVYVQMAQAIRKLVRTGDLPPGTPLPPERVLCARFGVSRMTLRQAFAELEPDHIIESRPGRGTFVSQERMRKHQQQMRSFTEEIRAHGGIPRSRLLAFAIEKPGPAARDFFALADGEKVYRIERIRLSNETPLAVESVQIPCRLCPHLERVDLAAQSLYAVLERQYGLRLARCVETISASPPAPRHRRLLELPPCASVLVIERNSFTGGDTPVEMGVTTFRGDAYRAVVHSARAGAISTAAAAAPSTPPW
ncbi:MAG: GntR family transcriptional regulator [Acidobacteriota bacterium]